MSGRVEKIWLEFERMVMPLRAPDDQRTEMRKAFYAGGFATLTELSKVLDADKEPTDAEMAIVTDMYDEFKEFFRRQGWAN